MQVATSEANKPRNILEEIVWHKDGEIKKMREDRPLPLVQAMIKAAPPPRDFAGALRAMQERVGKPGMVTFQGALD